MRDRAAYILSQFPFDFVPVRLCFSKDSKAVHFQWLGRSQEHKRELGIDLRYLAHIIESEPLEINNWLGLDIAFFDMIFAFAF